MRKLLPVMLSATFLYGFDANAVNVAIATLRRDLGAGPGALELVVAGYTFAYACGLVTGGRLGDVFGYRRMFLAGMAGFVAASALCGAAQTAAELVGARLLQGAAAAVMVPQVLALITAAFPGEARARALAWFGVTMGLSGVAGQVGGGLLLLGGWRLIFLVNVPVGLLALAAAGRLLPRIAPRPGAGGLDVPGALGLAVTIGLVLAPLALGGRAWMFSALAVPAAAATLWWEARARRPVLDPALLRVGGFRAGLAVNAAFLAFFGSYIFVLSLFLQEGSGLSPVRAGLAFVPMAVLAMLASLRRPRLITGCAITAGGVALVGAGLHAGLGAGWLIAPIAVTGLGNGFILPALIGAVLRSVPPERAGVASGTLATVQQVAGAAGVTAGGALFFAVLPHGGYGAAAAVVVWADAGLAALMLGLAVRLRRAAQPAVADAPVEAPVEAEAPGASAARVGASNSSA